MPVNTPHDEPDPKRVKVELPLEMSDIQMAQSLLGATLEDEKPGPEPASHPLISKPEPLAAPAAPPRPPVPAAPAKNIPKERRNRLVVLYDKLRYSPLRVQLDDLRKLPNEDLFTVELSELDSFLEAQLAKKFYYLNICVEYTDGFVAAMEHFVHFLNSLFIGGLSEICYHFQFDPAKNWSDYSAQVRNVYQKFIDTLSQVAPAKVVQVSIINKYNLSVLSLTEKDDLVKLGQEIQDDIKHWTNLRVFDYGHNKLRFLPGLRFPDLLEIINVGGGHSLETLTGFRMPPKLKLLIAQDSCITTIDNVVFPTTLERLNLVNNRICFLNYAEFPPLLLNLDVSHNRLESLKNVNFPHHLKSLSLAFNSIDNLRGVKFPEGLEYLDISCIPNESMTSVKFPDLLTSLNLQQSMTNTRGLKLPLYLKKLNLGCDGINSINPLKLPNTIESLYLGHNNIKTLNKVQFPTALRELYLGNNLVTTLKNVVFPSTLEVLDIEMDPETDEYEKHITTLKDVVFPPNLKVLKLGYHSIKVIESIDFPPSLISLSLAYNELRTFKNVKFGNKLKVLDLSGNQELTNLDLLVLPESVIDLRIPSQLLNNLPPYIVERANNRQLVITKSEPYPARFNVS